MSEETLYKLAQGAVADSGTWFPRNAGDVFFTAACLSGEVGEVLNYLKKIERGSDVWDADMRAKVSEEVADVFTYLLKLAGELDLDLYSAYQKKREINEARFGPVKIDGDSEKCCERPGCCT